MPARIELVCFSTLVDSGVQGLVGGVRFGRMARTGEEKSFGRPQRALERKTDENPTDPSHSPPLVEPATVASSKHALSWVHVDFKGSEMLATWRMKRPTKSDPTAEPVENVRRGGKAPATTAVPSLRCVATELRRLEQTGIVAGSCDAPNASLGTPRT